MTSIANCDPGTLDIGSKGAAIPRFTPPSPDNWMAARRTANDTRRIMHNLDHYH